MIIVINEAMLTNKDVGLAAHSIWNSHVHQEANLQTPEGASGWEYETILEGVFYGTPKEYSTELELSKEVKASLENWGFKPQ